MKRYVHDEKMRMKKYLHYNLKVDDNTLHTVYFIISR